MFKPFFSKVKRYFGFSNSETGGFLLLIIALLVYTSLPLIYRMLSEKETPDSVNDQAKLEAMKQEILSKIDKSKNAEGGKFENNYEHSYDAFATDKENFKSRKLFDFDPNTLDLQGFNELGIPNFIGERIIKYRSKGGKFKTKEDLRKIYGLLPATYSKIEPYIKINSEKVVENFGPKFEENNHEQKSETNFPKFVAKKPVNFDLNKADTTVLKQIPGVGSTISARIVNFRDKCGGFYDANQVKDVYGVDSVLALEILKYGSLKNAQIKNILINEVHEIDHPYLRSFRAKAVVAYRNQHGSFKSADDLKKIKILDSKTIKKITPYLKF